MNWTQVTYFILKQLFLTFLLLILDACCELWHMLAFLRWKKIMILDFRLLSSVTKFPAPGAFFEKSYCRNYHSYCRIRKVVLTRAHTSLFISSLLWISEVHFYFLNTIVPFFFPLSGSLDMSRSNSMTSSGQCRLSPLIPCIQDSSQLYDFCVKILFKLHASLPSEILAGMIFFWR